VQAESQHTPSTQNALAQSDDSVQVLPFGFTHAPGEAADASPQYAPAPQLATPQQTDPTLDATQCMLAHSSSPPHDSPSFVAGTQLPVMQTSPIAQSVACVATVQLVLHAVPAALHAYWLQLTELEVGQLPDASQYACAVRKPSVHPSTEHRIGAAGGCPGRAPQLATSAARPSHVAAHLPVPAHGARGVAPAALFGWGAPFTGVHVPSLPVTSHA
jgi:hypothetical protein